MRNGQNKRMRGRNRNNKSHHGHHHNPLTRVYESNGPDVKIRGTAHHIAEKYVQLARDAMASGDPVTAENHHQHAEHYFRLIAAAQEQFRQQNPYYQAPAPQGEGGRDEAFDGDDDDDNVPSIPMPGQPNFGGQPQPYQQQQPQPYGQQQPQHSRPQHQSYPPQPYQPQSQPPQYQPQSVEVSDAERLPSFITGAQPQPAPQNFGQNGHDNQDGERFPRHRRRRHRGRPDAAAPDVRDDGPDDARPGN